MNFIGLNSDKYLVKKNKFKNELFYQPDKQNIPYALKARSKTVLLEYLDDIGLSRKKKTRIWL